MDGLTAELVKTPEWKEAIRWTCARCAKFLIPPVKRYSSVIAYEYAADRIDKKEAIELAWLAHWRHEHSDYDGRRKNMYKRLIRETGGFVDAKSLALDARYIARKELRTPPPEVLDGGT